MDISASTEKTHDRMLCTFPFPRPWLRGEITYLEDIKDNNKKTMIYLIIREGSSRELVRPTNKENMTSKLYMGE